ncbi:MAG TPA: carboxypeptidase-like regulatory domain-containing protein [Pirellulales bacterium]|nr:carboxypeptidase-like regulatory domain-containing protein [Pirellulales bacterium]
MQRIVGRLVGCVAVALLATGCGGGRGTKTYPVKGTVTLQGQPLADVVVSFYPEQGSRPPSGMTDAEGAFALSTFESKDGAPAGRYQVAIHEPAPEMAEGDYSLPPEKPPRFPVKYTNPRESELVAEVKSGSDNTFTFDLK